MNSLADLQQRNTAFINVYFNQIRLTLTILFIDFIVITSQLNC